ncbi:MAG TPA: GntR family transcriptional regulator [Lachnospiraceae bacterium]|nr:GntR family transcriptional regulator [Lachnospiraceae bacterium]
MLTYSFTDIGSDSLYLHLYKCIKKDILAGVLAPETKLPSKRSFAKNMGISNITVENAYAQLQSEGYIYSIPKKGFYITDISNIFTVKPKINTKQFKLSDTKSSYLVDFVSNKTNPENFPFSIWAKLMRETITDKSEELMINSPSGGIMELRSAICKHLKQFRNMIVNPEQIIIGAGTEYLYSIIIQLLGHNNIYAVENPGYKKIAQVYKSNNVICKYVSLDNSGINISELEKLQANIAHVSPSHHYPTGIVTPISRRYELLGWASKNNSRYIIEDDYDSEFRLSGKPMPTLQSIDFIEKVIYINTFTKSLASTIRISYMVLPNHLLEKFYSELNFYSCTVSNFEQYTLAKFINDGYFEKHINRMRNYYRGIRDKLLYEIKNSPISSHITISEEEAGLHFLMYINTNISDEDFIKKAEKNGINISCLSQYYLEHSDMPIDHTLIMNYSGLKSSDIKQAIFLLSQWSL